MRTDVRPKTFNRQHRVYEKNQVKLEFRHARTREKIHRYQIYKYSKCSECLNKQTNKIYNCKTKHNEKGF